MSLFESTIIVGASLKRIWNMHNFKQKYLCGILEVSLICESQILLESLINSLSHKVSHPYFKLKYLNSLSYNRRRAAYTI